MVVLGRLQAPWGVKGQIRAESFTDPPAGILEYPVWFLSRPARGEDPGGWDEVRIVEGRAHGARHVVVSLPGVEDPETARLWTARDVAVPRSVLPPAEPGEYYWDDLEGCRVVTTDGVDLGTVAYLMDMPANPVMVVKGERERWLPLVREHVKRVDTAAKLVTVDWDPEI